MGFILVTVVLFQYVFFFQTTMHLKANIPPIGKESLKIFKNWRDGLN